MVNYLYDLDHIEENHEAFANKSEVVASPAVRKLARAKPREHPLKRRRAGAPRPDVRQSVRSSSAPRRRTSRKWRWNRRTGLSLTYGALFERSGRAANALVALGVEPGDRVAVQIDKSPDMIVVMLACLRAGAVLLPLNTAYTLAELEYFLSDAKPALVLCRPGDAGGAARARRKSLALPAVESLGVSRDGGFAERIAAAPPEFATVAARQRRSGRDPLYFRHDRTLERRDADA